MEDNNQPVTIQEVIGNRINLYNDILDDTDVTSDEHKEAFRNFAKSTELLLACDKQTNENNLAWAKHDLEVKRAEQKPDKSEIRKEVIRYVIDLAAIFAPIACSLIKQSRSQYFASLEMDKMCYYEENGTIRTYPGKAAWKMVENETKNN